MQGKESGAPDSSFGARLRGLRRTERTVDPAFPLWVSALMGAISGFLAYLAFPPADIGLFAFIALVPLVVNFRRARAGGVAISSAAFSIVFFGLLLSWLRLNTPLGHMATVFGLMLWVLVSLQVGYLVQRIAPGRLGFFAFPIAFLGSEYFRGQFPLGGFSWGVLGYSQHDNLTALRLVAYTGVWGLSFLILLVNASIAEAIPQIRKGTSRVASLRWLAPAAILIVFPALIPQAPGPTGDTARIAMVQGNVPEDTVNPHLDDLIVLRNHVRATQKITQPVSLVVWPEGALERDPLFNPQMADELGAVVRETRRPFLVGTIISPRVSENEHQFQNSSLFLSPQAKILGLYIKQRLVPYGEWVPFRDLLTPYVKGISSVPHDITPGKHSTVFSLPQGKFSVAICYESTYPDLIRSFVKKGARFLVVSSNNSSFGRSAASRQHVAFAQLRAAEHRMWITQTALSGISAVVAPDGRVTQRTKLFKQALLTPEVRFAERITPYAKFGDWVPITALGALAAIAAGGLAKRIPFRRQDDLTPAVAEEGQREPVSQA